MLKTATIAGLFTALCAASAVAQAGTWTFSYVGFFNESSFEFDSLRRMDGSFTGHDADNDGYIDTKEISSLVLNNIDYIGCRSASNDFYRCGADSFRYKAGEKLQFSLGTSGTDPEGIVSATHYINAGDREVDYRFQGDHYQQQTYWWTDETRFTIAGNPLSGSDVLVVPEPGTWAMLGTGLLLITATALRRRRTESLAIRA
jgi:hypothetical protein